VKPVKLDNWIYSPEKTVTLVSISKPYLNDGIYWVEVRFLPENSKKYERPFSDFTLLIKDGKYKDGIYQLDDNETVVDLNLTFSDTSKPKPFFTTSRVDKDGYFGRYTFGFNYNGEFYVLPLDVLIRDVLAPDAELLNILTSFDILEGKFIHSLEDGVFKLDILSDLPIKYARDDEKIRHLAWLFTNQGIEQMLAEAYKNISEGKGLLFDWNFSRLKFKAVINKHGDTNFIQKIIHVTKRINAREISVSDSRDAVNVGKGDTQTNRNRIVVRDGEELTVHGNGAYVDMNNWVPNIVKIEYESMPRIIRIKKKNKRPRNMVDLINKTVVIGNGKRITGELGGEEKIPQLIFQQHSACAYKGVFSAISEALEELQKDQKVSEVQSYVAPLFCRIDLNVSRNHSGSTTVRSYFAGKIIFLDGREAVVLDIQWENRSISMLLLISKACLGWDGILHEIMYNTVAEFGNWPNETLSVLHNEFSIRFERCRHTKTDAKQWAKRIKSKCDDDV
jgi:hypothetical protein